MNNIWCQEDIFATISMTLRTDHRHTGSISHQKARILASFKRLFPTGKSSFQHYLYRSLQLRSKLQLRRKSPRRYRYSMNLSW